MKAVAAIAFTYARQEGKLALIPLAIAFVLQVLIALPGAGSTDLILPLRRLVGLAVPAIAAFGLGLSLFGPELRQNRLSFFLSKPCAAWELWIGRVLGGLGLLSARCMRLALFLLRLRVSSRSDRFKPRSWPPVSLVFLEDVGGQSGDIDGSR